MNVIEARAIETKRRQRRPAAAALTVAAGDQGRTLTLPYPPAASRYFFLSAGGKRARATSAEEYAEKVQAVAALSGVEPSESPVAVTLRIYHAPNAIPVLSQIVPVVLDALAGIGYEIEDQVCGVVAQRRPDSRTRVEVDFTDFRQKSEGK